MVWFAYFPYQSTKPTTTDKHKQLQQLYSHLQNKQTPTKSKHSANHKQSPFHHRPHSAHNIQSAINEEGSLYWRMHCANMTIRRTDGPTASSISIHSWITRRCWRLSCILFSTTTLVCIRFTFNSISNMPIAYAVPAHNWCQYFPSILLCSPHRAPPMCTLAVALAPKRYSRHQSSPLLEVGVADG